MPDKWKKIDEIVHIHSKWLDLYYEIWDSGSGEIYEYWRVSKADSLIVVTTYENKFILPKPMFRPGIGEATLDFPGGRILNRNENFLIESAEQILKKELNVSKENIANLKLLDTVGKNINSSFNSQRLYVAYAEIKNISPDIDSYISYSKEKIDLLQEDLSCLQCSYALLQFNKFV